MRHCPAPPSRPPSLGDVVGNANFPGDDTGPDLGVVTCRQGTRHVRRSPSDSRPRESDRHPAEPPAVRAVAHPRRHGHAVVDPVGDVDFGQDHQQQGALRAPRGCARGGGIRQRAGRAAAEARRDLEQRPAAPARRARGRGNRRLGGERGAGDHPQRSVRRAPLLRAVRPARRFIEPRRVRRRRHDLQHPAPRPAGERRTGGAAAARPGSGRSRLCALWIVDRIRAQRGPWRRHVRARPGGRRVHAGGARPAHAGDVQELLGERRQSPQLPRRLPALPRLGACTASCSRAACSCIPRQKRRRPASCG